MKSLNLQDKELDLQSNSFNHFVRVDHIFISSKIISKDQINELEKYQITKAIDIKETHETEFNDEEAFKSSSIEYIHFPISKVEEITFEELFTLNQHIENSKKNILLYCMSGNRVSALLALISCFVKGHPKNRALNFSKEVGLIHPDLTETVTRMITSGRLG
jgi:protein tyrosine phosphatase (PTP) superfamily phosphohydrolase (DUF442 family)